MNKFKVTRCADTPLVAYGPQSDVRVLIGDDQCSTPIRSALQTCKPGYLVSSHWHPYIEYLIILQGSASFNIEVDGGQSLVLHKGDAVEIHPEVWHEFTAIGNEDLHVLGIHLSPARIVNYRAEVRTDARGFRIDQSDRTASD